MIDSATAAEAVVRNCYGLPLYLIFSGY